jgi:hypothetical protein
MRAVVDVMERSSSLVPDAVLPSQFFGRQGGELQPEKRLMLAVLEHAVATFLQCERARGLRGRRMQRELESWFGNTDMAWPFAFERICETLGLDAPYIRRGLARWRSGVDPRGRAPSIPFRRVTGGRHVIGLRRVGRRARRPR